MTTAITIGKDNSKLALVATMIAFLDAVGHKKTRSRIPGCPVAPPVIEGQLSNERPDIYSDHFNRPLLCEAVSQMDMSNLDALKKRLELFHFAADSKGWTFYLACYKTLAPHLKAFCARNQIRYSRLYEI